jgi:ABC-type sulfate transport system permease component
LACCAVQVLVRYSFRQKLVDALVDLPFALPTAVAAS